VSVVDPPAPPRGDIFAEIGDDPSWGRIQARRWLEVAEAHLADWLTTIHAVAEPSPAFDSEDLPRQARRCLNLLVQEARQVLSAALREPLGATGSLRLSIGSNGTWDHHLWVATDGPKFALPDHEIALLAEVTAAIAFDGKVIATVTDDFGSRRLRWSFDLWFDENERVAVPEIAFSESETLLDNHPGLAGASQESNDDG
jgi:hypothetical protein